MPRKTLNGVHMKNGTVFSAETRKGVEFCLQDACFIVHIHDAHGKCVFIDDLLCTLNTDLSIAELYSRDGALRLDAAFLAFLSEGDKALADRLAAGRK